jgi:hypothetical protein
VRESSSGRTIWFEVDITGDDRPVEHAVVGADRGHGQRTVADLDGGEVVADQPGDPLGAAGGAGVQR